MILVCHYPSNQHNLDEYDKKHEMNHGQRYLWVLNHERCVSIYTAFSLVALMLPLFFSILFHQPTIHLPTRSDLQKQQVKRIDFAKTVYFNQYALQTTNIWPQCWLSKPGRFDQWKALLVSLEVHGSMSEILKLKTHAHEKRPREERLSFGVCHGMLDFYHI